jgi:hypothetical protein
LEELVEVQQPAVEVQPPQLVVRVQPPQPAVEVQPPQLVDERLLVQELQLVEVLVQ